MNNKSPSIAFLLALFPGGGLFYLGKLRGIFYTFAVFGIPIVTFGLGLHMYNDVLFVLSMIATIFFYIINIVDTVATASRLPQPKSNQGDLTQTGQDTDNHDSERFFTIILSFVPGLGHFQLGLVNRGLTLLLAFIGFTVMILFITALSRREEFLIFLAFLAIIWVYGFFDAAQQLTKKQKGENLVDRSILEEFEMRREDGKKSKSIATFLSIFPGAGHLYLGMQRRGIQLMAAFLFSIYILDVLRLGIFLFVIPIIWFYSFFDGLQMASKFGKEPLEDKPIISYLLNHQRWFGIGLIVLGCYYLFANIVIPISAPFLMQMFDTNIMYWFNNYFQTTIVCLLLIGGGVKLMAGKKQSEEETK